MPAGARGNLQGPTPPDPPRLGQPGGSLRSAVFTSLSFTSQRESAHDRVTRCLDDPVAPVVISPTFTSTKIFRT